MHPQTAPPIKLAGAGPKQQMVQHAGAASESETQASLPVKSGPARDRTVRRICVPHNADIQTLCEPFRDSIITVEQHCQVNRGPHTAAKST